MEITKTFYAKTPKEWRKWLLKNHAKENEIWLIYYKKHSGKPRVEYGDAVSEALCFGWIDSTVKKFNEESFVQRFTPRNTTNNWSELNKEKARIMIKEGKMTPAGLAKIHESVKIHKDEKEKFKIPKNILKILKTDEEVWDNFRKFPETYKRIRGSWITATKRPNVSRQRLDYFLKMTKKNKKFGMLQ